MLDVLFSHIKILYCKLRVFNIFLFKFKYLILCNLMFCLVTKYDPDLNKKIKNKKLKSIYVLTVNTILISFSLYL